MWVFIYGDDAIICGEEELLTLLILSMRDGSNKGPNGADQLSRRAGRKVRRGPIRFLGIPLSRDPRA